MEELNKTAGLSGENDGSVTQPVTTPAGEVADVTLTNTPPDVGSDAQLQELKQKLEARDQDLNKLKSSLQSAADRDRKAWEMEKQRLLNELQQTKLSSMTDDQKKQYERDMQLEQAQAWKNRAEQLERTIQERELANNYIQYFRDVGVAPEALVVDSGLDALVQSGWDGLSKVMSQKEAKIRELEAQMMGTQPQTPTNPNQPGQRNPITTPPSSPPSTMTWDDIKKRYDSLESFFQGIERGEISPSLIPKG